MSCLIRGTTQIGKSPAIPPPIWKKPIEDFAEVSLYQSINLFMYSRPVLTVRIESTLLFLTCPTNILPSVESSQPGTKMGRFFSAAASNQEFLGSISYSCSSFLER